MRSSERLIEVLKTVNESDGDSGGRMLCKIVADMLAGIDVRAKVLIVLEAASELHHSPHIRELATEALHYLKEDTHAA